MITLNGMNSRKRRELGILEEICCLKWLLRDLNKAFGMIIGCRNDKHQRCESDFKVRNRSGEKTNRHKDYSTKLQYDNYKTREQMIKMCHEDLKLTLISFQKDLISSSGIKLGKDYNSKPLFSGTYTSKGKDTKSILDPHPTLSFNNYSQINSAALYPSIPPSPKPTLPSSSKTPTSQFSSVISRLATLYTKKLDLLVRQRDIEWEKRLVQKQFDDNFYTESYGNSLLKKQMEENLTTAEGRKLFQKLLTLQTENEQLKRKNERSKHILSSIRLNYFKEINNLREISQPWRSTQTVNDYLQVRYFVPTEGMDKSIVDILNTKLNEMKKEYDQRISAIADDLNDKTLKIQAYQELAPSSYGLLDMKIDQILEGVKAMEKDPQKLWKSLTKAYTRQFFDSIIESEYKDYLNEVSTREMIRSVNKIKKEMNEQLNDVRVSMEAEKKSLRYQINMKIEENNYLRSSNINLINRARREAHLAAEEKFQERVNQLYKKFDEEKHELYAELQSLKKYAEDHNYFKNQMTLRLALVKFRYTVQIMKVKDGQKEKPIKDITDDLRRVVMGKQIEEHEERMKELDELKDQHDTLKIKNANTIYKMHELSEQIKLLEKNLQEMQDENGSLSSMLSRERQNVREMKLEIQSLRNGDKINKEIIEVLEHDKIGLKEKVESLSKQLELKDPEFIGAGDLRDKNSKLYVQKALQQINDEKFENMKKIISEDTREIGTITDTRGIEDENESKEQLPKIPRLTAMTQTDKELYKDMAPDIPLSDIKAYHKLNALEKEIKQLKKKKGIKTSHRMYSPSENDDSEISSQEDFPDIKIHKKKATKKHIKHKSSKNTKNALRMEKTYKESKTKEIQHVNNETEINKETDSEISRQDSTERPHEEIKDGYNLSFMTKANFSSKPSMISKRRSKPPPDLTEEQIKAAEMEIDKKTVTYIFKLKQNNPQINPEIFAKAIEYIRIGAKKKLQLHHYESEEHQMARLYPENQPEVFGRLWEEVNKRKLKQQKLKIVTQKQTRQIWINKLKDVRRSTWNRLINTKSEYFSDISRYKEINTKNNPKGNKTIRLSKNSKPENTSKMLSERPLKYTNSSSGIQPIINKADINMLNPTKMRECSFITDFVRSRVDDSFQEHSKDNHSRTVTTQTEIKGRVFDEVDDEILDEIINNSMMDIGYTEFSEYDIGEHSKQDQSHNISLWKRRRKSDNAVLEKNSSTMSNRSSRPTLGPLSQRISLKRKRKRFNVGTSMNSSVVFTRRNIQKLDLEENSLYNHSKNEDYSVEGLSLKNLDRKREGNKNLFANKGIPALNNSKENNNSTKTGIIGENRAQISAISVKINKN
ncbi:unnamed protein product [Moneuplotes crassus]|uniref:Uncharacterized protein n=1 Tax=Euplotes crassus TaxID=5936 RepID=A0AAD1U703_EUPCR|nr:unnamed protein product [Moneuplotes crassus]